jgi:hypothetical protein
MKHNYFFSMSSDAYGEGWERIFRPAITWMDNHEELIPPDLLDELGDVGALKTVAYYMRVLTRDMRRLYNGEINTNLFVDNLAGYVERQLRRAWNEGMRSNGITDMTPEWEAIYQQAVTDEYDYIERLADQIVQAKQEGKSLQPFLSRAELWANRYTDVVNRAKVETGLENFFIWEYGETEDHCETCAEYVGQVKTGLEWKQLYNATGIRPQSKALECGGWRCDCRLQPRESRIEMLFAPAIANTEMLFAPAVKSDNEQKPAHTE